LCKRTHEWEKRYPDDWHWHIGLLLSYFSSSVFTIIVNNDIDETTIEPSIAPQLAQTDLSALTLLNTNLSINIIFSYHNSWTLWYEKVVGYWLIDWCLTERQRRAYVTVRVLWCFLSQAHIALLINIVTLRYHYSQLSSSHLLYIGPMCDTDLLRQNFISV